MKIACLEDAFYDNMNLKRSFADLDCDIECKLVDVLLNKDFCINDCLKWAMMFMQIFCMLYKNKQSVSIPNT